MLCWFSITVLLPMAMPTSSLAVGEDLEAEKVRVTCRPFVPGRWSRDANLP